MSGSNPSRVLKKVNTFIVIWLFGHVVTVFSNGNRLDYQLPFSNEQRKPDPSEKWKLNLSTMGTTGVNSPPPKGAPMVTTLGLSYHDSATEQFLLSDVSVWLRFVAGSCQY